MTGKPSIGSPERYSIVVQIMQPIEFDFTLTNHASTADAAFRIRGTEEWILRETFLKSARLAFSRQPDLAAQLHGGRKVRLGKRGDSRSSLFPSKKNAATSHVAVYMPVESRLEQAYALCLERHPGVVAYRTQAISIDTPGGRAHWPDFLILDDQGRVFVREVKRDKSLLGEDYRQKVEWVGNFLARVGIDYALVERDELPPDLVLRHLKSVHQSYARIPSKFEIEHALAALPSLLPCTYQTLVEALGDVAKHLLFVGVLSIDWEKPFDMGAAVWKR